MMRTTAGSAISTARTTGSVTLPPGLPLAYVVDAVTVVLMIKRHANPITSITRKNQLARCDCVSVDPDLYIISNLPLVTEEKHSWKLNTSYHIQTRIRTISEIGCTVPFTFVRNGLSGDMLFEMSPRKRLRTRRGGGRVVWGGDACVAYSHQLKAHSTAWASKS